MTKQPTTNPGATNKQSLFEMFHSANVELDFDFLEGEEKQNTMSNVQEEDEEDQTVMDLQSDFSPNKQNAFTTSHKSAFTVTPRKLK